VRISSCSAIVMMVLPAQSRPWPYMTGRVIVSQLRSMEDTRHVL